MRMVVKTDQGKQRGSNQDYANTYTNEAKLVLGVICDGLGGHQAGDIASEMVVSHLGHSWEQTALKTADDIVPWLQQEINRENERLVDRAEQYDDLKGMGTTLVAVAEAMDGFIIANIGDSRAYRLTDEQLVQITNDHSLVGELMRSGELTEEEALNHPQKNVLTRSLGVRETLNIDLEVYPYESADCILLCSDGLTNMVADKEVEKIMNTSETLNDKAAMLIDLANKRGGKDNITLFMIDLKERKEE